MRLIVVSDDCHGGCCCDWWLLVTGWSESVRGLLDSIHHIVRLTMPQGMGAYNVWVYLEG